MSNLPDFIARKMENKFVKYQKLYPCNPDLQVLTGVHVHGRTGDFPGVEMRGGQLIIDGDATRPCPDMKDSACIILGRCMR